MQVPECKPDGGTAHLSLQLTAGRSRRPL